MYDEALGVVMCQVIPPDANGTDVGDFIGIEPPSGNAQLFVSCEFYAESFFNNPDSVMRRVAALIVAQLKEKNRSPDGTNIFIEVRVNTIPSVK